jgi:hypothetical protein
MNNPDRFYIDLYHGRKVRQSPPLGKGRYTTFSVDLIFFPPQGFVGKLAAILLALAHGDRL